MPKMSARGWALSMLPEAARLAATAAVSSGSWDSDDYNTGAQLASTIDFYDPTTSSILYRMLVDQEDEVRSIHGRMHYKNPVVRGYE